MIIYRPINPDDARLADATRAAITAIHVAIRRSDTLAHDAAQSSASYAQIAGQYGDIGGIADIHHADSAADAYTAIATDAAKMGEMARKMERIAMGIMARYSDDGRAMPSRELARGYAGSMADDGHDDDEEDD